MRPADRLAGPPSPVVRVPAGWTPALDGPWPALGRAAFDAFVRATAEALVADLSALSADVARKGGGEILWQGKPTCRPAPTFMRPRVALGGLRQ